MPVYCFLRELRVLRHLEKDWIWTLVFVCLFVKSEVCLSSSMAVMELKPIIKLKAFLMLPFPLAQLLEQNRFSVLCSFSSDLTPDHYNFIADRSWNKKAPCLFWCSRHAFRVVSWAENPSERQQPFPRQTKYQTWGRATYRHAFRVPLPRGSKQDSVLEEQMAEGFQVPCGFPFRALRRKQEVWGEKSWRET